MPPSFYYVAAAINAGGRYWATNTILLGDRITPQNLAIGDRKVVVDYADRRPVEPFSATPSVDRTMAVLLHHGQLLASSSPEDWENVTQGWVTIGHEVRSYKPCNSENDLWLMGQSPALDAIMAAYRRALPEKKGYRPLFMVLAGKQVEAPEHGFGVDYEAAFLATRLVRVVPGVLCLSQSTFADLSETVRQKIDFDVSALDDAGLLGSPEGKRALSYEYCIPKSVENRTEVEGIDPTVRFFSTSPGRIGCGSQEILCIGSTHQKDFATVLRQLAELPYVHRIEQTYFE